MLEQSIGRGRFEVQATLGTGAFGTVLAAFDRERGHLVAIKRPHQHTADELYRFKKEFRALADLSHPNLVSLYELFEDDGNWFFTMELIDGVPLTSYLRQGLAPSGAHAEHNPTELDVFARTAGSSLASFDRSSVSEAPADPDPITGSVILPAPPLPDLDRLRGSFAQVCLAVQALHASRMLHRDIKPSNILATASGRIVVLDFGLIRQQTQGRQRRDSSIVGTPLYMAPELWLGERIGEPSDWYSVGVMLYEALLGAPPFRGTLVQLMQAKSAEAYVGPRGRNPDIPADLDALCRELLRVGVDARPRADEILRVFQPPDAAASDTALPIVAPAEVFVGRAAELAALRAAHADCAGGVPVVVHLSGEPGIGKTALVHAFLDELPSDARVLHGRCHQQESVPFKALDAVIDELAWDLRRRPASELQALLPRDANLLARVFPVLQRLVGATDSGNPETSGFHPLSLRRRAFAALRELLRRLSHVAPIVVWIDDLQWGDRDSAAVLHALLRPPDPPRLLLILGYRPPDERADHPFLRELQTLEDEAGALPGTRALVLQRLPEADGRALVDALVAAHAPPSRRARVVREAAGIPLLLDRLARSVAVPSDSSARLAEASQEFDDGRDLLAQLVDRQLAGLPAAARAVLELVAVAGAPLDLRTLRIAAGQPTLGRTILHPLRARHLLTLSSSELVAPAFAQVAAIVVAGLAPESLRRHHLALAGALAGHAPPRRVAAHFAAAGQLEQAGIHALTAARQAADALAFSEAAACYRLALTWRPGDAAQQRRLRRALADALVNAGRCSEAAHLYLDLAEGSAPADAIVLRRLAAEQLISCGELDRGEAELRAAVRAQGLDYPDSTRAAMLAIAWGLVRLKLRGTRYTPRSADQVDPVALARVDTCLSASRNLSLSRSVHAVSFAVTSLRLALDCGEHGRVVEGLAAVGGALGLTGNATGKQLFAQAEALADTLTTARARGVVALWRGFFSYGEGRWADARTSWSEAATLLGETPGLMIDILRAQAYLLLADMHLGLYADLELHTSAAMAVARETGNLYTEVTALMYSALPRLAAGDLGGARERIRESEARTPRDSWNGFSRMKLHIQCDFYAGDGAAALARLEAALPEIEATRMRSFTTFRVVVGALHAGAALQVLADGGGDRKTLLKIVRRELARFIAEPMPFARGLVALTRAALARVEGDRPTAVQLLELAVQEFTTGDCWVEATCASRRLGQLRGDAMIVASADATLRARGIAEPARWTACFAPGFANPSPTWDCVPPQ